MVPGLATPQSAIHGICLATNQQMSIPSTNIQFAFGASWATTLWHSIKHLSRDISVTHRYPAAAIGVKRCCDAYAFVPLAEYLLDVSESARSDTRPHPPKG